MNPLFTEYATRNEIWKWQFDDGPSKLLHDCDNLYRNLLPMCDNSEGAYADEGNAPPLTAHYDRYNIFTCTKVSFYDIFKRIKVSFREKVPLSRHVIRGWLNVYTPECPNLGFHKHWPLEDETYHGYYVVITPPNKPTTYKFDDGTTEVVDSYDNLLVMSPSGRDIHKTTPVDVGEYRVTIAFDIVPLEFFDKVNDHRLNHFVYV